jgi:hypothetical protein
MTDGMPTKKLLDFLALHVGVRRTGLEWCEIFNVNVTRPNGWTQRGLTFEDRIYVMQFISALVGSDFNLPLEG